MSVYTPPTRHGPVRTLPTLNRHNRGYWTGGEDGRLHLPRCGRCGYYIFPPAPVCRQCNALTGIAFAPVSGLATVITFTINHHPWAEGQEPYAMALVGLDEQADLRIVTNIVHCPPEDIHIGMRVEVVFEHVGDVWVPLFRPAGAQAGTTPRGNA